MSLSAGQTSYFLYVLRGETSNRNAIIGVTLQFLRNKNPYFKTLFYLNLDIFLQKINLRDKTPGYCGTKLQ
jgi:hypothetical protein